MIFFNTRPWYNACFKALMWTTQSFLSYKLDTSLLHLLIFIFFLAKWQITMKIMKSFMVINICFKNIFLNTVFIIFFFNFLLNLDAFFFYLKTSTDSFWDNGHQYRLFASKYIRYRESLFLLKFFIYLSIATAYLCIAWHIPPLIRFSTSSNISTSVDNYNFIPFFWEMLAMLIQVQTKNWQDQAHILQCIYF